MKNIEVLQKKLFRHKMKEMLSFAATQINLEGIRQCCQSERGSVCDLSFTGNVKSSQTHRNRVSDWLSGTGRWRKWRNIGQRIEVSSYKKNEIYGLINSMVIILNNTVLYT